MKLTCEHILPVPQKIRQKGLLKTIGTQIDGWNEAHDIKSGQVE